MISGWRIKQNNGFQDIQVKTKPAEQFIASFEDYWRPPVGGTGQAARMSDPQEEKWRRRIGQAECCR
jgi:hypothetical protein